MGEFNLQTQGQHVELAEMAYNRGSDGKAGPADTSNMPDHIMDRYDVKVLVNNNGDVVYGFREISSGELFVAIRGTDDYIFDTDETSDWVDYQSIAFGQVTTLGQRAAEEAEQWAMDNGGGKITVVGQSLGGLASEEVGRLIPELVESVTSVQGPSVRDGWTLVDYLVDAVSSTLLMTPNISQPNVPFHQWAGIPVEVPVNRIVADGHSLYPLGLVQGALDYIGTEFNPPTDLPIGVTVHSSWAVYEYYMGVLYLEALEKGNDTAAAYYVEHYPSLDTTEEAQQDNLLFEPEVVVERDDDDGSTTTTSTLARHSGSITDPTKTVVIKVVSKTSSSGNTTITKTYVGTETTPHIQDGPNVRGRGTQAPLVVDLDGDGVEIETDLNVAFDVDGDGYLENTAWAGKDDGFLVIDLNADGTRGVGDGKIDQTKELILTKWLTEADATDLQALAEFDKRLEWGGNNDGILDASDTIWSELRIWNDVNQDGVVDAGELHSLSDHGITQFNLSYDDGTAFSDASNNIAAAGSKFLGGLSYFKGTTQVTGGAQDLALAYDLNGWKRTDTADGYSIQYESGEQFDYGLSELDVDGNFNLTALGLDGATGDDRNNVLNASGSLKAVTISGGVGNDTLTGGWDDDLIAGGVGADVIRGNGGNDVLFFDTADTVVEGGEGMDVAYATEEDIVDANGVVTTAAAGVTMQLDSAGIEAVYGGDGADVLDVANTGYGTALSINGGKGNDTLTSGAADDTLSGDAGDDTLSGNAGDDTLIGGAGEDTITGGSGADFILGGTDNDTLNAGVGDDFVLGGTGDDAINGSGGDDYLDGGAGSDVISGGFGDDFIIGGSGYDVITTGGGDDYVDAGSGNDTMTDSWGDDTYKGGSGDDILIMSAEKGKETYFGGKGNDTVKLAGNAADYTWTYKESYGQGKGQYSVSTSSSGALSSLTDFVLIIQDVEHLEFDDQIVDLVNVDVSADNSAEHKEITTLDTSGGAGDDTFTGTNGNDTVNAWAGDDIMNGKNGNDILNGHTGADKIYGGNGVDELYGGYGSDILVGGDGNDTIDGGTGNDTIIGDGKELSTSAELDETNVVNGGGADILSGGDGEDTILGGKGNDTIHGDDGADFVNAGTGNDLVYGDSGADQLYGGDGADIIHGGLGDDYIVADSGYSLDVTVHLVRFLAKGAEAKSVTEARVTEIEAGEYSVVDVINSYLGVALGNTADGSLFPNSALNNITEDELSFTDAAFLAAVLPRVYGRAATATETAYWQTKLDNGTNYAGIILEAIEQAVVNPAKVQSAMVVFGEYTTAEAAALSFDDTVFGEEGDDEIYAGKGNDTVYGGAGHDKLHGGAGDDSLTGGAGSDKLLGGTGTDTLIGGKGADVLEGGHGADVIHGDNANNTGNTNPFDTLSYEGSDEGVTINVATGAASGGDAQGDTFDGIEWVAGSEYDDTLTGDTGDNRLFGNGGRDKLYGGSGDDQLYGGGGHDILKGEAGNDRLYGGSGDDRIKGEAGDDLLAGGAGDDILFGGDGVDVLVGDDGEDIFMLQNNGQDTVEDFKIGTDTVGIWGEFTDVVITQDGDDAVLTNGTASMRLTGVVAADLTEVDFTLFRYGTYASETMDYSTSNSRVHLDGASWNDTLIGSQFDDIIRGSHGNDHMQGGLGDDKYIIDLSSWGGANWDTITDTDGVNTIRVDGSISVDQITATGYDSAGNASNDLVLTFGSTGKKVTIVNQLLDLNAPAVEFLELSNGEIIDMRIFHDLGGDDTLIGASGADTLNGYVGNDDIDGLAGNDVINGDEGNDHLKGGDGADTIHGGLGDDYITGGFGFDITDGGEGVDTVDVSHSTAANTIDLTAGTVQWAGTTQIETATNFENAVGSQGANTILGTDGANVLDGQDGNDTLTGGLGRDTLMGGAGNDVYVYNLGDGSDVIIEGDFDSNQTALSFDKNTRSPFGATGEWSNSRLSVSGDGGAIIGQFSKSADINGGSYETYTQQQLALIGGTDKIVFGAGITQSDLTFTDVGSDLLIHLPDGATITIQGFVTQKIETLEFADGSTMSLTNRGDVTWTGAGTDNYFGGEGNGTLTAKGGNDSVQGSGGNDTISGGTGNDSLYGGAGNDSILGGSGNDTIYGDSGDDRIQGEGGTDYMDGGVGNDTLVLENTTDNLEVDLAAGVSEIHYGAGNGTLTETTLNFENVESGSGNDSIKGTDGANIIDGAAGDDVIEGRAGDDTLSGGTGSNTFVFSRGDGMDTITDFNTSTDTLRIEGAATANIIIQDVNHNMGYNGSGRLITYGWDADGNPVDQIFLDGVPASAFSVLDIDTSVANVVGGTSGADTYAGTDAHENISMNGGIDNISAGGGNDDIDAGGGDDIVHAGAGNDRVIGGIGADRIWLDDGNDIFVDDAETGLAGRDIVYGGAGDDLFLGAGGNDVYSGDAGNDTLNGGVGNDTLIGDTGATDGKLIASYYRLSNTVNSVNDIPVLTEADGVRIVGNLNVNTLATSIGGRSDYYGIRYVGTIVVSAAGDYTFKTGSDDGSQLWIDGELVVDNDGLHAMAYQSGVVSGLTVGQHEIEIRYVEKTGGNTLEATVQGPDTGATEVDLFASSMLGEAAANSNAPTGLGLEDILNGDEGNDYLRGGSGADVLNGGTGTDTALYRLARTGLTIDLGNSSNNTGIATGDTYIDIENVQGSNYNDTITGNSGANRLIGWDGDDVLDVSFNTAGGWQYVLGKEGNDTYIFGKGYGAVFIYSSSESATSGNNDSVKVKDLNVSDFSYTAYDYTQGGTVANNEGIVLRMRWNNGNQWDELRLANMGESIESFEFADGTIINDFQIGSAGADTLIGSSLNDYLGGGAGNDTLFGGAGDDVLDGGTGTDTIHGGDGDDTIYIATNQWWFGGVQSLSGGAGYDKVIMTSNLAVYTSNIGAYGIESIESGGGNDVFAGLGNIDYYMSGNDGNDSITSSSGNDTIKGGAGNDTLSSGAGADIINGGSGNDVLTSGVGADIIELDFGSGSDVMTDFEDGVDIIDLSATGLTFADLTIANNGAGDVVISFDDGDAGTALDELTLTGITANQLTASDFQFG